jgi:hypothetical protein
MKAAKIAALFAFGLAALLAASGTGWAQTTCDLVPQAEDPVPPYYGTGFFADQNPLNPLALFPQRDLVCQAAIRGLETKVQRDITVARYDQREASVAPQPNVQTAEIRQWRGSEALNQGNLELATAQFRAAENSLNGRG